MTKTEQLNSLFDQWKESKEEYKKCHFAEDGIIREEEWDKANRKILFVLKETNNCKEDFREYVNKGP